MWVSEGLSRKVVNGRVGCVRRMFRWAVSEERVPVEAYQRLQAVEGLRAGQTPAPDHEPVRPAPPADVEKALPWLSPRGEAGGRRRPPAERYTTAGSRRALERACEAAGVPPFSPHRVRHLAATRVRAALGVDAARALLGHTLAAVTAVDRQLALKAVERFG